MSAVRFTLKCLHCGKVRPVAEFVAVETSAGKRLLCAKCRNGVLPLKAK